MLEDQAARAHKNGEPQVAPQRSDRGDIASLESRDASSVASRPAKSVTRQNSQQVAGLDIMVGGHRVHYLRAGSGPPLVLIHGLLAHSFSWRYTISALAQRFTLYAPDVLGIGFSERVRGLDCSMLASARRMIEFLDAAALSQVDLVGTSHGGALAAIMAAEYGQRVRRLVLVAPVNPWSSIGRKRIAVLSSFPGGWLFRATFLRIDRLNTWVLRRLYANPDRIAPGTLEGYAEPLKIAGSADYLLGVVRGWHRDVLALKPFYKKIRVPTLLVWGDQDAAVMPASAAQVQRAIAGSRLLMMPGVGHLPYEEAPEEFNRVLLEFLT
jgi:4,5:9,10-diseco-3-hydroxy-5,9,17-trioxoandrosta-1(10),2-diene-4-oate hydrolase